MVDGMLSVKSAVATGGTNGIGRAIALKFSELGADVVVGDIDEQPQLADRPTAEAITGRGGEARFVDADVTDSDQVDDLVQTAVDAFGSVDVMVNSAGILKEASVHEMDLEDWRTLMAITLDGVFYGTRAALQRMVEQADGQRRQRLLGQRIDRPRACARLLRAKGAVTMLTRQNAIDYGDQGIRVNAVGPGGTLTALVENTMSDDRRAYLESQTPMSRLAQPEEIADAAAYLASDMASYVNGHVLVVDGGFSIG